MVFESLRGIEFIQTVLIGVIAHSVTFSFQTYHNFFKCFFTSQTYHLPPCPGSTGDILCPCHFTLFLDRAVDLSFIVLVYTLVYINSHTGKAFFSAVDVHDSGTDRQPLPQESVPFTTSCSSTSALFKFLQWPQISAPASVRGLELQLFKKP